MVLINLNGVTRGWAHYIRHAVATHVISKLDDLV
ncbi:MULTISPECIES: group II intron maturase-specific domain-containing protein [unclassified Streptomyces]